MSVEPEVDRRRLPQSAPESRAGKVESLQELLDTAAVDSTFFCRYFFPNTARVRTPDFHVNMDELLESHQRLVNLQVFRGGAKTSKLRMYAMKRAVFGISRTATVVGKSQGHAEASIQWMRKQVETNTRLKEAFRIRPGKPWTNNECVIISDAFEVEFWIKALGIDGSVRGVLKDDYRPDLIILDDPIDDENAATEGQRDKINERIHGALKESLASSQEFPDAKLALAQTPMHRQDASMLALEDPEWRSARYPIWTDETADLPIEKQVSRWPELYPTEEVRRSKRWAIQRNMGSVFIREKECRIVARETSAFKSKWLKHFDLSPAQGVRVLWIDPVPPPSEADVELGKHKNDFEAFAVVQRTGDDYYLLETAENRGHDPSWTVATFFELNARWRPMRTFVEAVAYQRTLMWILKKAMEQNGFFHVIEEVIDQRPKYNRIVDALNGVAAMGHLYTKPELTSFISQFEEYPNVSNDDVIEAVASAVGKLQEPQFRYLANLNISAEDGVQGLEAAQEPLNYSRGAP